MWPAVVGICVVDDLLGCEQATSTDMIVITSSAVVRLTMACMGLEFNAFIPAVV